MKKNSFGYLWLPILIVIIACSGSNIANPIVKEGNTDAPTLISFPTQTEIPPTTDSGNRVASPTLTVIPLTAPAATFTPSPIPTSTTTPIPTIAPTQKLAESQEFHSLSDLQSDVLYQISLASGGAGGCGNSVGLLGSSSSTTNGAITLSYDVYRQSEQHEPWWGDKFSKPYEQIEFGDMVYFNAHGFAKGENVTYTVEGPNGKETYTGIVDYDVAIYGGNCAYYATAPAARLEWVADPKLGTGIYTITVSGNSGDKSINLTVINNTVPTFGAVFGKTGFPLTLGADQMIHAVYAGFSPSEIVTTILLRAPDDPLSGNATAISYFDTQVDNAGNGRTDIKWDATLPNGIYWLLVPKIVPDLETRLGKIPGTWSIEFFTNDRFNNLFSNPQAVLLRPSCGKELTAKQRQLIDLTYGIWGANGQDILNQTKDKITTKLFVSDIYSNMQEVEISGIRSNSYTPMSQIPCGNQLPNGYFLLSETKIGPYPSGYDVKIRVEYSFGDTITDGYDFSPQDGILDLYGPTTPFSQTYTIKIVP